jgi:hypothetical protein
VIEPIGVEAIRLTNHEESRGPFTRPQRNANRLGRVSIPNQQVILLCQPEQL